MKDCTVVAQQKLLSSMLRRAKRLGVARVSVVSGVSREHIYRSLSAAGNPRLSTFLALLGALGVRIRFSAGKRGGVR